LLFLVQKQNGEILFTQFEDLKKDTKCKKQAKADDFF